MIVGDCVKCHTLRFCVDHGFDGVIQTRDARIAELEQQNAELKQAFFTALDSGMRTIMRLIRELNSRRFEL